MDVFVLKFLFTVITGAASVGTVLLIGIAKNVNSIDKKLTGLIVKVEHLEKATEEHKKEIKELQKA